MKYFNFNSYNTVFFCLYLLLTGCGQSEALQSADSSPAGEDAISQKVDSLLSLMTL